MGSYNLVHDMDFVRSLCSGIHSIRKDLGIVTTQPLKTLTIFKGRDLEDVLFSLYKETIEDECNIEELNWDYLIDEDYKEFNLSNELTLNFREAGKLFGKDVQTIGKMIKNGDYHIPDHSDHVVVGDFRVPKDMVKMNRTAHNHINSEKNLYVLPLNTFSFLVLDTMIYPNLYLKKLAQEVTKLINRERRERGFSVTDFVDVVVGVPEEHELALKEQFGYPRSVIKNAKCNLMTTPAESLCILAMKGQ